MTAKQVAVEGTRGVVWSTVAVLGALVLVGGFGIQYGRGLQRQDHVEARQAATKAEQDELIKSVHRIEGKLDTMQQSLSSLPNIEARVKTLENEVVRMERERRLLQDRVERRLGINTDGD